MTQQQAIINHINEKGFITGFTAAIMYGVHNLPQRIKELKGKGYNIATRKKAHVNRYGHLVHYVEYFFIEEEQSTTATKTALKGE